MFAGIGLFRIGLEQAGFTCAGHCEIDKFANKSYAAMHNMKDGEWYAQDIREVKGNDLPDCSLWTAGFPCQDVSIAGNRQGLSGDRSGLFFEIIRLLQEKRIANRPRFLLLENVKGMFSSNGTRDFAEVLYSLAALGYSIEYALCNSKNFGVPQNRERVFIICDITGRSTGKIFPLGKTNAATLKQILGFAQGQRVYETNGLSTTLAQGGGGQGGKTGLYFVSKDNKKGLVIKDKCGTIDASYSHGLRNHQHRTGVLCCSNPYIDKTLDTLDNSLNFRIRRLTPLECFRLQGIPDSYFEKAAAVCSDTQLYRQAGNGVTVPVVYAIGKRIQEIVKEEETQNTKIAEN